MAGTAEKHAAHVRRSLGSLRDEALYPVEDDVGEDILQRFIAELLRPLIARWYDVLGKPRLVGADQFIYYRRGKPRKVVSPDVYDLPGVPPDTRIGCWKVWETGIVPDLAIEIVSPNKPRKDYDDAPARYGELGVKELIVFDPDHEQGGGRVRWQRYRKLARRGFVRVEHTNADRIHSRVLGCWLRVVGEGGAARLRLGTGPEGDELFPTAEEAERTAKEAERAAKEAALARVAELEALLAKRG